MPDTQESHPFDGQFEPPAEAVAKANPRIPLPEIAQASIAISLKRIADMMKAGGKAGVQLELPSDLDQRMYYAGQAVENGKHR
jgi:hypothetical protein